MDATAPAARFAWIIETLRRAIAERAAKGGFAWIFRGLAAGPLIVLLWNRLRRTAARFTALATKLQTEGPQASPRRPRIRKPDAAPPRANPPLPRGFAWLHGPVPEAAASAGMLREFLNDPEMHKLIAADSRFGRILRPLCHMLGLRPPPFLRLVRADPSPATAAMPAEPEALPAPATILRPPVQPEPTEFTPLSYHTNSAPRPPSPDRTGRETAAGSRRARMRSRVLC